MSKRSSKCTANAVNGVLMALRCVDIMKLRRATAQSKHAFSLRVGVATGQITSGVVSCSRLAFDAWGVPMNLASRLQNLAPKDGVLVCSRTREEAAYYKMLHFEGPLLEQVKGLGQV
jgi:class 3 adenylate cyclase